MAVQKFLNPYSKRFIKALLFFVNVIFASLANATTLQEAVDLLKLKKYTVARPIIQEYADNGNAEAQGYLAKIYRDGLGTKKDFGAALFWASKAALKNDSVAQEVMAYLYLNGFGGLKKDNEKAMTYLRKSADQEYSPAVDLYSQLIFQGKTKSDLVEVENTLKKDKSVSSSLALMILYSNHKYKPSNIYKSFPYALQSIKRGASSPIWHIIEFSKYMQFTDVLNAAWLKALYDLKNPDVKNYPNYKNELNDAINSLQPQEILEVNRMNLSELILKTEKFVGEHERQYGPINAKDLVDEGWSQFVGERGDVNEPFAQLLLEEALRKAIALGRPKLIAHARNNLGVVLGAAVNPNVRNKRLALVHIIDGADSNFGPDNLLWFAYEGKVELSNEQIQGFFKRYKELEGEDHVLKSLGPLNRNLKRQPEKIIKYLIKKYEEKPSYQIADQIADMYEDNFFDLIHLEKARHWYGVAGKLIGEDSNLRLHRVEKIIAGKFVKNLPDMRNSIDELFEIRAQDIPRKTPQIEATYSNNIMDGKKFVINALVIGNSRYRSSTLPNAVNDSYEIAKKLRSLGFDVTYRSNLPRKKFVTALVDFSQKSAHADLTVFFYSGHGVQMGGVNYLLPTDVDFDSSPSAIVSEGISLNDLLRRNLPGKNRVVFLDACRTNPVRSPGKIHPADGLAPINAPRSTLVSFATRDGSIAFDSSGGNKNSPYTTALVSNLDKEEDIAVLLRWVREEVLRLTQGKQEPWEYGSLTGGRLIFSKLATLP